MNPGVEYREQAPGEVFSFNEIAAPLDYDKAKTFSDGGIGFANGGGLCQVSSTLYMAAQYAGLEIVERHPHYAVLPYIKPGFDATVWFGDEWGWGVQDMRFKNTTDGYVVVREWVDKEGFLNAEILGRPTGKNRDDADLHPAGPHDAPPRPGRAQGHRGSLG